MALQIWLGNAAAVAQVINLTVGGTAAAGQIYSATMGFGAGKTVSYTALSTDSNATIATALQALLAASIFPEFREVLWGNAGSAVVSATGTVAGIPFVLACSATGAGTLTQTTIVPNSGPSDISVTSNWSNGSMPATGDDIYFQSSNIPALYNLQVLAAVSPANVYIDSSFTAAIGLPVNNPNGYREYRQTFLQFNGVTGNVVIGQGQGQASGKVQIDFQSGNFSASVWKTAGSSETGMPAVQFKGGGASSAVNVNRGTVGLALLAGQTANVPTLDIDYVNSQGGDAQVWAGPGCTLTTVNMNGGMLNALCAVPTLNSTGGSAQVFAGNMTEANLQDAGSTAPSSTLQYSTGGTIAAYSIGNNCLLDCSGTLQQVTGTNGTIYSGGTINAPGGNFVMTNSASIPDGQASDVTLNLGNARHIQVT